jgi:hypothetical protein
VADVVADACEASTIRPKPPTKSSTAPHTLIADTRGPPEGLNDLRDAISLTVALTLGLIVGAAPMLTHRGGRDRT